MVKYVLIHHTMMISNMSMVLVSVLKVLKMVVQV